MQALRNASGLARLLLAWFALAMCVAVASPLVKPVDLELVCSGGGAMKLLVKGDDGGTTSSHTLDCPLCAATGAPPPVRAQVMPLPSLLAQAAGNIPAARIAALTAAPLPARGPPAFAIA